MKKIIGVALAIVIVLVALGVLSELDRQHFGKQLKSIMDTRFWVKDENYSEFYAGNYSCSADILPGNYDVRVRGGVDGVGVVRVAMRVSENGEEILKVRESIYLHQGDQGFHFNINDGEYMNVDVHGFGEMVIKKVS